MISHDIMNEIKNNKSIAIFTHISPDGDCLGSGMALYYVCKKMGKDVCVFNADEKIHSNYNFLIKEYVKSKLDKDYDLFISVDCASLSRLGSFEESYKNKLNTINIDHHASNTKYAKLNYLVECSSCCEILYNIFKETRVVFDKDIATALFTGLSTDTGRFLHSNTTSKVHLIASELLKYDIDLEKINYYMFNVKTKSKLALYKRELDNLQYFENDKIAITGLSKQDFKDCLSSEEDDPHLVDIIAGVEGVKIGITYLEDSDGGFNISFRTLYDISLDSLAKEFGGGGHKKASGCKIYLSKENVIKKLVQKAKKYV